MAHRPPPDPFALKHEIFILDSNLTHPLDQSRCEPITKNVVQALLETLGMLELGPLEIYQATDLRAPGWSFIQPITTSHISAHYFEKPGRMPHIHLDVYSCESVRWKNLLRVLHEHLSLADWRASFIVRGHGDAERSYSDLAGTGDRVLREQALDAPVHTAARIPAMTA